MSLTVVYFILSQLKCNLEWLILNDSLNYKHIGIKDILLFICNKFFLTKPACQDVVRKELPTHYKNHT